MKRHLALCLALCLALVPLLACTPLPSGSDAGDAGDTEIILRASGTASVLPLAAAFLADAGLANPGVAGLELRIEEPLKVALSDPLGVFGSLTLDAAGAFSVPNIPSELVNLGVAAGIRDNSADGGSSARIVRSATVLYDVALEGIKPQGDITNGKAYAIPTAFHDKLNAAIGTAAIQNITGTSGPSTLQTAGWVLGRVVDANGNPVSGVTVQASPANYNAQFFYPTADLASTTTTGTSANGLFVFVHTGGQVATFRITLSGRTEYKQRNLGAAKDACLVLTYYPGLTPPP